MTKTVTRYEILDRNGSDENVAGHPKSDGEWVRYDDIKHLLHDEPGGEPDPLVQCRCGWRGKTSELPASTFGQGKVCPNCAASFRPAMPY